MEWVGCGDNISPVHKILLIFQYRFRFVELYYRRAESVHKGKLIPARIETVVLFLPDVWSCLPTHLEWDNLQVTYKQQLDRLFKVDNQNKMEANDEFAVPSAMEGVDEKASKFISQYFVIVFLYFLYKHVYVYYKQC